MWTKKYLHDPDNHNGVITHLEPIILEREVKWALESITMNKASGGDGIPVELFQVLKDDAVKVLHSICQQIWKTQQWPQDWKSQFSVQSQRKAHALEKEMAIHSSTIAWKIPWTEEPGTAEFSRFAGILSAALSQHHLSGFGIAQLEFHHLRWLCS